MRRSAFMFLSKRFHDIFLTTLRVIFISHYICYCRVYVNTLAINFENVLIITWNSVKSTLLTYDYILKIPRIFSSGRLTYVTVWYFICDQSKRANTWECGTYHIVEQLRVRWTFSYAQT